MAYLLLQCPSCKQQMKYLPITKTSLSTKAKQCVYCGKRFKVLQQIVKKVD